MVRHKHATLACIKVFDNRKLFSYRFLSWDHTRDAGADLLEGAQHELEGLWRVGHSLGFYSYMLLVWGVHLKPVGLAYRHRSQPNRGWLTRSWCPRASAPQRIWPLQCCQKLCSPRNRGSSAAHRHESRWYRRCPMWCRWSSSSLPGVSKGGRYW